MKAVAILFTAVLFMGMLLQPALPASAEDEVPHLLGYVTDEVGILEYSGYYLDTYWVCDIIHNETSCEMAVLIVNSTGDTPIAQYAIEVFNSNGIGNVEKDNGVLIVIATGDEAYFVAVGRGLEYVLNDAKVGRFARDYFVFYAQQGEVGYGIYALTVMIGAEIAENYEQSEPHSYPIEWIPLEWPQLIIAFCVLGGIFVITKGRIILWIGPLLWRFGGGKTGGGGAGGKY